MHAVHSPVLFPSPPSLRGGNAETAKYVKEQHPVVHNLQTHVGMTSTAVFIASTVGIDRFNVSCLSSVHVRFP